MYIKSQRFATRTTPAASCPLILHSHLRSDSYFKLFWLIILVLTSKFLNNTVSCCPLIYELEELSNDFLLKKM